MFRMLNAFSAYFVADVVRGSRTGKYQAVQEGKVLTHRAPYGFKKSNGSLEPDDYTAPIIRELFDLYANRGYSLSQIVKHIEEKGYPTATQLAKQKNSENAKWTHKQITRFFRNPAYIGRWEFGNKQSDKYDKREYKVTTVRVPPLIGIPLFDKVGKMLDQNRQAKRRQAERAHPLVGHLVCANCGGSVRRRVQETKTLGTRVYYYCTNSRGKNGCDTEAELEGVAAEVTIANAVLEIIESPENVAKVLDEMERDADSTNEPIRDRIDGITAELDKAVSAKDRIIDLYTDGVISKSDLDRKLTAVDKRIVSLEDQLSEQDSQLVDVPDIDIDAIRDYWEAGSFEILRNLIGEDTKNDKLQWPITADGRIDTSDISKLPELLDRLYDVVNLHVVVEGMENEKYYHVYTDLNPILSSVKA